MKLSKSDQALWDNMHEADKTEATKEYLFRGPFYEHWYVNLANSILAIVVFPVALVWNLPWQAQVALAVGLWTWIIVGL